jgi:hypothetical protein
MVVFCIIVSKHRVEARVPAATGAFGERSGGAPAAKTLRRVSFGAARNPRTQKAESCLKSQVIGSTATLEVVGPRLHLVGELPEDRRHRRRETVGDIAKALRTVAEPLGPFLVFLNHAWSRIGGQSLL